MSIHTMSDERKLLCIDRLIIRERRMKKFGHESDAELIECLSAIAKEMRAKDPAKRSYALKTLESHMLFIKQFGTTKESLQKLGQNLVSVWQTVKSALEQNE